MKFSGNHLGGTVNCSEEGLKEAKIIQVNGSKVQIKVIIIIMKVNIFTDFFLFFIITTPPDNFHVYDCKYDRYSENENIYCGRITHFV